VSEEGDLEEAVERIEGCPGDDLDGRSQQIYYMAGEYQEVLDLVEISLEKEIPPAYRGAMHTVRAWTLERLGRETEAVAAAATARDFLRAALKEGPDNAAAHAFMAMNLATFGSPEEALGHARQAVEITAADRFDGPQQEVFLAGVLLRAGRHEEGLALLDRLLVGEYDSPLTVPFLRVHWFFEPFQDDPGFRELLARHEIEDRES
jgi:tetratricopeptide (TPR) repeat protein